MKTQIGVVTLAVVLCCGRQVQAAEQSAPSVGQRARDEVQQLLKDRDEIRPKAKDAAQRLQDNGLSPASLGFERARATRDQEAASGSKLAAYERYLKTANKLERKIRDEVGRGVRGVGCDDIARFERLQAEIDLTRIRGLLPADEK